MLFVNFLHKTVSGLSILTFSVAMSVTPTWGMEQDDLSQKKIHSKQNDTKQTLFERREDLENQREITQENWITLQIKYKTLLLQKTTTQGSYRKNLAQKRTLTQQISGAETHLQTLTKKIALTSKQIWTEKYEELEQSCQNLLGTAQKICGIFAQQKNKIEKKLQMVKDNIQSIEAYYQENLRGKDLIIAHSMAYTASALRRDQNSLIQLKSGQKSDIPYSIEKLEERIQYNTKYLKSLQKQWAELPRRQQDIEDALKERKNLKNKLEKEINALTEDYHVQKKLITEKLNNKKTELEKYKSQQPI